MQIDSISIGVGKDHFLTNKEFLRQRKRFQRFMLNLFLQTAYSYKAQIDHLLYEIRQLL